MARLPQVPRRGELIREPQARAGGDVIASPYRAIAAVFEGISDIAMTVAEEQAAQRGQNAVTRDENGEWGVQFLPPINRININYNRAAASALLARQTAGFETAAAEMARQSAGDPEQFDRMWTTFTDERVSRAPAEVRGGVETLLTDIGEAQRRGVMSATFTRDMSRFHDDLVAERQRLAAQLLTLANQGGGSSPEFQSMAARYRDIGLELAENPNFSISLEAQQWADDRFQADLTIETVMGEVSRRFANNPAEAAAYAERILNDPALPLTAEERRTAIAAAIQPLAAANRAAIDAFKDATADTLTMLNDTNLPFNLREVEQLIAEGMAVGAYDRVIEIQRAVRNRTYYENFAGNPDAPDIYQRQFSWASGQAQAIIAARGPGLAMEGLNPDFGTRLADAIAAAEAATGERVSLTSLVRTQVEQAELYRAFMAGEIGLAAPPGTSRHEIGAAADIAAGPALDWLHEHAHEFGLTFLSGSAFTADPGHIQLAGPAGDFPITPELLRDERQFLTTELNLLLGQADTLISSQRGFDMDFGSTLVDYARAVNDPALSQRVADAITKASTGMLVNGLSTVEAEQLITALQVPGPVGDEYAAAIQADAATARSAHLNDLRENDPYRLGVELGVYKPAPLDFSDPAALAAGLSTRAGQLAMLSAREGIRYGMVFEPEEAAALSRAFTAAPVEGRLAIVQAIAEGIRDPAVLSATLAQIAGEEAGPLAAATALMRLNPAAAEGIVRGGAIVAADPRRAPKDDAADGFSTVLNRLLPLSAFAGAPDAQLMMRGQLAESIRLLYVSLAAEAGHAAGANIDERLLRQAIDGVTGGLVTFNGQSIIAPLYGMDQRQFDLLTGAATPFINLRADLGTQAAANRETLTNAMRFAQTAEGLPIVWDDVVGRPDVHLENVGDGRYLIRFGEGATAVYAQDARNGAPFVLNLAYAAAVPLARSVFDRLGIFRPEPDAPVADAPFGPALPATRGATFSTTPGVNAEIDRLWRLAHPETLGKSSTRNKQSFERRAEEALAEGRRALAGDVPPGVTDTTRRGPSPEWMTTLRRLREIPLTDLTIQNIDEWVSVFKDTFLLTEQQAMDAFIREWSRRYGMTEAGMRRTVQYILGGGTATTGIPIRSGDSKQASRNKQAQRIQGLQEGAAPPEVDRTITIDFWFEQDDGPDRIDYEGIQQRKQEWTDLWSRLRGEVPIGQVIEVIDNSNPANPLRLRFLRDNSSGDTRPFDENDIEGFTLIGDGNELIV